MTNISTEFTVPATEPKKYGFESATAHSKHEIGKQGMDRLSEQTKLSL